MLPPLFLQDLSKTVFNVFLAQSRPKLYDLQTTTILVKEKEVKMKSKNNGINFSEIMTKISQEYPFYHLAVFAIFVNIFKKC